METQTQTQREREKEKGHRAEGARASSSGVCGRPWESAERAAENYIL